MAFIVEILYIYIYIKMHLKYIFIKNTTKTVLTFQMSRVILFGSFCVSKKVFVYYLGLNFD